ncbi:hypothetical protein D3C80_537230 [compost metagenome]
MLDRGHHQDGAAEFSADRRHQFESEVADPAFGGGVDALRCEQAGPHTVVQAQALGALDDGAEQPPRLDRAQPAKPGDQLAGARDRRQAARLHPGSSLSQALDRGQEVRAHRRLQLWIGQDILLDHQAQAAQVSCFR